MAARAPVRVWARIRFRKHETLMRPPETVALILMSPIWGSGGVRVGRVGAQMPRGKVWGAACCRDEGDDLEPASKEGASAFQSFQHFGAHGFQQH